MPLTIFKNAQRTDAVRVCCVLGFLEGNRDVALRRQIVNLIRLHLLHDADQIGGVGQIAVVQDHTQIALMRVLI